METFTQGLQQAIQLLIALDPALLEVMGLSLRVALTALALASLIGVPAGTWLALVDFPLKSIVTALVYTGMGLPPVVVGLVVYLFLSRNGPLGDLSWLFTPRAMITAQTIIAAPLVTGVTMSSIRAVDPNLRPQLRMLGATRWQITHAVLHEARFGVIVGTVVGFGRVIAEVGAVMLVGGNIDGKTRVMTTAIVLETRRGNFDFALALGIILLTIAFILNFLLVRLQGRGAVVA